jgi:CelD/BcsL family acetyltransferase involved in cellulose biosynthesis
MVTPANPGRGAGARLVTVQIDVLSTDELNPVLLGAWLEQHRRAAHLASPFFHAAFSAAVAHHRNVRVVMLHDRSGPRAFVPFCPGDGVDGTLLPGEITGHQGAVIAEFTALDATRVLDATGLRSLRFDRAPVNQAWLVAHGQPTTGSSVANLAGGFDAYLHRKGSEGLRVMEWFQRTRAALDGERGALSVVFRDDDAALVPLLSSWRATPPRDDAHDGLLDALVGALLPRREVQGFEPVVSSVRAGTSLIGVHLGLRSGRTLHSFVTATNPAALPHTPGVLTLVAVLQAATAHGIATVDLGTGDEPYRRLLRTGVVPMMRGEIRAGAVNRRVAKMRGAGERLLQRVLAD